MERFCQYKGTIYLYKNKINGKVYVGQTIHNKDRIRQHKNSINKQTHFARAIKKYGFETFDYKVLFQIECSNFQDLKNTLNTKEIIAIKFFDSTNYEKGYNISKGGNGTLGVEPWNKGKTNVYTKEHIEYLKKIKTGLKHSDKTKEKISKSKKGTEPWNKGKTNVYSNEARKKMSESHKRLASNGCERPVLQYSRDGLLIKTYNSIKDAIAETDITNISAVCSGRRKTAGGFIWKYAYLNKINPSSDGEVLSV